MRENRRKKRAIATSKTPCCSAFSRCWWWRGCGCLVPWPICARCRTAPARGAVTARPSTSRNGRDKITDERWRSAMRKTVLSMALVVVIGVPAVLAQGGTSTVQKNSGQSVLPAPVGHRQPRAGDVPSEKNLSDPNNPANKEDAALDKKIKS